jgi:hypothetical protein
MRPNAAVVAIVLSALPLAGCGAGRQRLSSTGQSYRACGARGLPTHCLRFLDRTVGVTSIQLTANVPRQVTATSAQTARLTQLPVTCPPLVPAGAVVNDHELYCPQLTDRRSHSISINNGQNPGRIHWEIGAIKGPARALWIVDRSNWVARPPKRPARLIGNRRYLGQVVTLYRFPNSDGQLEGHDAAFATKHGISYFVSIHGHTHYSTWQRYGI